MIKDAILALKEKSGSHAIVKYVEEHHKADLPRNLKKILGHLKNCVTKGILIKFMASFKLSMLPIRRKLLKHATEKKYGAPRYAEKKPKADASKKKKATSVKPVNKAVVKKAVKSTPLKHKVPISIKEG